MEPRLVDLGDDRPVDLHPAHVVNAVHAAALGRDRKPDADHRIAVTSDASRSSLQPSVPAGRSGSTR
jgi:hypothetical protein